MSDAEQTPSDSNQWDIPMSADPLQRFYARRLLKGPSNPGMLGRLERFEILRLIGEGGMGVVFLVRDPVKSARVALKTLKPELAHDPRIIHRFLAEAEHMRRMDHPNILPVYEVFETPESPYFTMPFMERGSVVSLLNPEALPDRDLVLRIALEVAKALEYSHKSGIIHRDLKPANVLLDATGKAYLTDFGLLRTMYDNSLVDLGIPQRVGTSPYMSPAVAAGESEDTRCDIYAFGALLYELLTGHPPYTGPCDESIIRAILKGPPRPILDCRPQADRGLAQIAQWAMARQLRSRYASMSDVRGDLERLANDAPRLGPHAGRHWPYSPLVTSLVVAFCVLLMFVIWAAREHQPAGAAGPVIHPVNRPLRRITFNLQKLPAPGPATAADIADLNGDGYLDIVCGQNRDPNQPHTNYVYWGRGNREFQRENGFGRCTATFGLRIADFTGDDVPDVLMAHYREEFPSLLFENREGQFQAYQVALAPEYETRENGCMGLAVGDLDGDGDLDAVSGQRGGYLYVSFNDGTGWFQRTRLGTWGGHDDLEIADMDGDGFLDIIDAGPVDDWSGHSAIYWNDGHGLFPDRTLLYNAARHFTVSVADMDSDGDMDLAFGVGPPDPAAVFRNEGNRRFVLYATFATHVNVVLADLDDDGQAELITSGEPLGSNIDEKSLHIYWDCDPNVSPDFYWRIPSSKGCLGDREIEVADLDGDGTMDIFAAGEDDANYIFWGKKSR